MGANQEIAPLDPMASRTNLLHTGQPTAKKEMNPPSVPILSEVSVPSTLISSSLIDSRTYVAIRRPPRIALKMTVG